MGRGDDIPFKVYVPKVTVETVEEDLDRYAMTSSKPHDIKKTIVIRTTWVYDHDSG